MTSFAEIAREVVAELGWPVFPVARDGSKAPLVKGGWHAASNEWPCLEVWCEQFPDANAGVPTGAGTGIVVIDIDGEEGEASLRRLLSGFRTWPETARVSSGRGYHDYFQHPGFDVKSTAGVIAPGIDVRGDRGSIIVPPSIHKSGKAYQWVRHPKVSGVRCLPIWLLVLLNHDAHERRTRDKYYKQNDERRPPNVDRIVADLRSARKGQRNHMLNRAAFLLGKCVAARAMSERQAFDLAVVEGVALGLSRAEATGTVRSGIRAGERA